MELRYGYVNSLGKLAPVYGYVNSLEKLAPVYGEKKPSDACTTKTNSREMADSLSNNKTVKFKESRWKQYAGSVV